MGGQREALRVVLEAHKRERSILLKMSQGACQRNAALQR